MYFLSFYLIYTKRNRPFSDMVADMIDNSRYDRFWWHGVFFRIIIPPLSSTTYILVLLLADFMAFIVIQ